MCFNWNGPVFVRDPKMMFVQDLTIVKNITVNTHDFRIFTGVWQTIVQNIFIALHFSITQDIFQSSVHSTDDK